MKAFSGVEGVRAITHTEGFAVPNHPHLCMFPALRGESAAFHLPSRFNDSSTQALLVERTMLNLALTYEENEQIEAVMESLSQYK